MSPISSIILPWAAALVICSLPEVGWSQQVDAADGMNGWKFLPSELEHVGGGPDTVTSKAGEISIPAIIDFARQLDDAGIRLIVMPVPAKAAIHADRVPLDVDAVALYAGAVEDLRDAGIEVLDLAGPFSEAAKSEPLFCERDTHWNGAGIQLAGDLLAESLRADLPNPDGDNPTDIKATPIEIEISGDLGGDPETVALQSITLDGQPLTADPESPLLLLGDSHLLVFHDGGDMHTAGAGLPDWMAYRLGRPVDVLGVRGSGSDASRLNLARRARRDPEYLGTKNVIVWCFAARDLTQSNPWRNLPVIPD